MKVVELIEMWEREAAGDLTREEYAVRLPLEDAAKLEALAEMFPRRTREQLITELLSVALDQVVSGFPYVEGDRVISRDEEGDPVFEDVGHTPRFLGLVRKHMERLSGQDG
ncbi:MAG: type 1 pili tip component [Halioglobus sp.]|jgi:hypothetical protein